MREIKFRSYNKKEKEMYIGVGIDSNLTYPRCVKDGGIDSLKLVTFKDITLMQYTGLKDKNGIEIYEGDIVKYMERNLDNTPCVVIYSGTAFSTQCTITKDLGDMYGFEFEVIGNIHENTELL